MGLIYLYPTEDNDPDHFIKRNDSLTLRSYGLPPLFWAYAIAICGILFLLYLPIHEPLQKYKEIGESFDLYFIYALYALMIGSPLVLMSFFFYEKQMTVSKGIITLVSKLFFISVRTQKIPYGPLDTLEISHFIDSPNMARIKDDRALKSFYNRGYHELVLKSKNARDSIILDRATRKADLEKIKKLIMDFL